MQLNDGSRFCIGCGTPVDAGPAEAPPPVQEQPVYQAPPEQPVYAPPPVQEQPVYQAPPEQPVYAPPPEQPQYAPPEQQWYGQQQQNYAPAPPPKKGLSKTLLLIIIIAAAAAAAVIIMFVLGVFGDRDGDVPVKPPAVSSEVGDDDIDDIDIDMDENDTSDWPDQDPGDSYSEDDFLEMAGWSKGWPGGDMPSGFPVYPNGDIYSFVDDGVIISIINTDMKAFEAFLDSVRSAGFKVEENSIFGGYSATKGQNEVYIIPDETGEGVMIMYYTY